MSKTSLEVDRELVARAAQILGTATLRETVDMALRRIVQRAALSDLAALLSSDAVDWDLADTAWGGDR